MQPCTQSGRGALKCLKSRLILDVVDSTEKGLFCTINKVREVLRRIRIDIRAMRVEIHSQADGLKYRYIGRHLHSSIRRLGEGPGGLLSTGFGRSHGWARSYEYGY